MYITLYSNSHSSPQKVDRDIGKTLFERSFKASQESSIKFASYLTVFSELVRQLHTCVYHHIYSKSHSSPQQVDRDIRKTPFGSSFKVSQESSIKSASNLTVFSQLVTQLHTCDITPIYSSSHSSPQKVDRDIRRTPFERSFKASQESSIKSASHLTVPSQLVRQLHTCVYLVSILVRGRP